MDTRVRPQRVACQCRGPKLDAHFSLPGEAVLLRLKIAHQARQKDMIPEL